MMRWLVPFACLALLLACDDTGGDDSTPTADSAMETDGGAVDMAPEPEPEPDAAPMPGASLAPEMFQVPSIPEGQIVERAVRLTNTGNVTFEVTALAVAPGESFQLLYRVGERRPIIAISFAGQDVGNYPIVVEPGATVDFILEHRSPGDGFMPAGAVTLTTTLPEGDIEIPIEAVDAVGEIAADPGEVIFGRVPPGETAEQVIEVQNVGAAPLTIQAIQLQGDMDFSLSVDGSPVDEVVGDPDGDGTPGLAAGGDFELTVTYAPVAEGLDSAEVSIVSDDPGQADLRIPLSGNDATGCITTDPADMFSVQFEGGEMMRSEQVTVSNCGGQPLTIDNIRYRAGTPPEAFAFADGSLPEFPHVIEAGEELVLQLELSMACERVFRGALQIRSNDPEQPDLVVELDLQPSGLGEPCPDPGM